MRYLLDTHVLLWWLFDDSRMSDMASAVLADPGNEILVSAASAWEISTKYRLGKLPDAAVLVQDMPGWLRKAGFRELGISVEHAQRAGVLPPPHRDPFDRMLAAQSLIESLPLVSRDPLFNSFGVSPVW